MMRSLFAASLAASLALAMPAQFSTPPSEQPSATTPPAEHFLRTMTNNEGYTMLIDEANTELGAFIAGMSGVDGIYNNDEQEANSSLGTDTWVDVHDGVYAVIDYGNPNHYTVYDSASNPIETISYSMDQESDSDSDEESHYMMTFVNQDGATLLVDQAVTDAAVLEMGISGVDGIYTIPPSYESAELPSRTDTWVDSANGYIAVIDYAHPNHYTVYDMESSPIHTISY
ncbi:hypothetical protein LPJ79_003105 [Coemansia sp. RSA 1821]|nr:hypothetical protein LPJ68_004155 [Coemansia sp. RSA 1086]KAJ1750204.1 hypothetical protein LPJ79_003105 [Coemansia sp. RSA 1821]KAJ2672629.1 hypothetical protein IWW42_002783 [Coemansia sp. RSA 1085]